jgi:exosortase A-associated hydrolase 1/exosortase A-associated hydrolase 2
MSLPEAVALEAGFVAGTVGPRFRLVRQPAGGNPIGTVIAVHAFAEEMNKSRHLCAQMAQRCARNGWRVVQRDLHGCGDSPGDFADASWASWLADLNEELDLADPALPVWIWGLRVGALLAVAALPSRPHVNLLLWQPVSQGAQHLQQFLRLHAGARIVGSGKTGTSSSPAQLLRSGSVVEVGGYELSPALAIGLEQASFDIPANFSGRIVWLEVDNDPNPQLSPATERVLEKLGARAGLVEAEAVTGPAFWQSQEIEECEPLLRRSIELLALDRGRAPEGEAPLMGSRSGDHISTMNGCAVVERAIAFRCGNEQLLGVLSQVPAGNAAEPTAVVIVVGGPQYRVGSHRQFVLLARELAKHGFTAFRFDYQGMGDSEGDRRTFEDVGPDLTAAVSAVQSACPSIQRFVLWGLCDAASAAMMFAADDPRVSGIVMVNPWARSEASLAATTVKHYYLARAVQADFWLKLIRGGFDWRNSLKSLVSNLRSARSAKDASAKTQARETFHLKMAKGLARFRGSALLILSGNDLTAKEFVQYTDSAPAWRGLLNDPKVSRVEIADADHTFSTAHWRNGAEQATLAWLKAGGKKSLQSPFPKT